MAFYGMPMFGAPPPMWGPPPPHFGAPPMGWGMFPPPPPFGFAPPPMAVPGNVGMAAGLYSSALAAPSLGNSVQAPITSLYASAPALPTVSKAGASKGTVGLMLWPNAKTNQLCVTGHSAGTSAAASKIEVGDAIESVNGRSVAGMKPEQVAMLMAGELGSFITVRTAGGIEARIERDVSAEEADAATVPGSKPATKPAAKPSPAKSSASNVSASKFGRKLTQEECDKYGVKLGATWGPGGGGGAYGYQRYGGIYRMPPTKTVKVRGVEGTQV